MTRNELMDVRELAAHLGLAEGTIYHLVSQKRIPFVRLSARCLRFRRSDIDAWVAEKKIDEVLAGTAKERSKR